MSRLLLRVCVGNELVCAPENLPRFRVFSLSRGPVFGGLGVFRPGFTPPEPRLLKTGFGIFFPARIFEREPWQSMREINLG